MPSRHKKKKAATAMKKKATVSSRKKPLYLRKEFYIVLVVAVVVFVILLAVSAARMQQQYQSNATAATSLVFSPAAVNSNIGDVIPLTITLNPGTNEVSLVKLEITYNPTYFQPTSATAFVPNSAAFSTVLEGPIYSTGKVQVVLSVGNDPTKAIQQTATLGTLSLTALGNVTNSPVAFSSNTQAFSVSPNDSASENVISSTVPAVITVGQGGPTSAPPTPTTVVSTPTEAPTPTTPVFCLGCPPPTQIPTTPVSPTSTMTPVPTSPAGGNNTTTIPTQPVNGTPTQAVGCTPGATNSCPSGTSCQSEKFGCTQTGPGEHCDAIGIKYVCLPPVSITPHVSVTPTPPYKCHMPMWFARFAVRFIADHPRMPGWLRNMFIPALRCTVNNN